MYSNDTKSLPVQDAPDIAGLTFRHFRGDEDYPDILAINTASKLADGLNYDLHTLETISYSYSNTANHDPYKDMLIAEVDGKMVAFNRVFMERELDGSRVYTHFGFVLPEYRGKGLGRAMIRWAEARIREREAEQQGGGPAYYNTSVASRAAHLEDLLKEGGYKPVRYEFVMETPDLNNIPEVPMPEGLEIRPVTPDQYRAIFEGNVEAFRDHWGASEIEPEEFDRWLNHPLSQPNIWVVAWDGDQVAGSILNYIIEDMNEKTGRKVGYTESISVRRPWRRKGLARAMLSHSMKMHRDLGMEQTALGVDTENPSGALQLYESMGYVVTGKDTTYRKPV
ncbi:MAG: GNAT family N-acetyltransferase [Chloroflexota bacterium]